MELNLRDPSVENLDAIIAVTEAYSLEIVLRGTGQAYLEDGISVAAADPDVRAQCVGRLKHHVDFAARVGAQVVIGGIRGRFDDDPPTRQAQREGAIDVVRQVADYAAPRQVTVTLEPITRYETNFINTLDDALAFIEEVERPGVKVLLDTFHMNIEEASMIEPFERAGGRLSHVHLVDSNRRAPGMGHIDFKSIIAVLRRTDYDGYLSGEFLPLPDNDTAAESNIAYVRQLLAD